MQNEVMVVARRKLAW